MSGTYDKWFWPAAFAFLSLLDLYLTWLLIEHSAGCVYEANPLAAWVLEEHGWRGLAAYKLSAMATVLVLGWIVIRARPRVGRALFGGAVASLVIVTGYSLSLWTTPALAADQSVSLAELHAKTVSLEQQRVDLQAYMAQTDWLAGELIVGHVTLADAADVLEERLTTVAYDPLRFLRQRYPELSDEGCISASLIRDVASRLHEHPVQAQESLCRLSAQFEERYGLPLPAFACFESHGETLQADADHETASPQEPAEE